MRRRRSVEDIVAAARRRSPSAELREEAAARKRLGKQHGASMLAGGPLEAPPHPGAHTLESPPPGRDNGTSLPPFFSPETPVVDNALIAWAPQPGPQYHFIHCPVTDVVYGGARGGGKTMALIGDAAIRAAKWGSAFRGLFIRRQQVELLDVKQKMQEIYPLLGAHWSESQQTWTFPGGGTLVLKYLMNENDALMYKGWNLCVGVDTPVLMADGFWKPIREIRVGEMVETLEGPQSVVATTEPYEAPCVELEALDDDGSVVARQVQPAWHPVAVPLAGPALAIPVGREDVELDREMGRIRHAKGGAAHWRAQVGWRSWGDAKAVEHPLSAHWQRFGPVVLAAHGGSTGARWWHFYSGEERRAVVPTRVFQAAVRRLEGERLVCDITVQGANHYISGGGFVSCNTALYVDEVGDFDTRRTIDLLWGAMRSTKGVPIVRRMSANPGGPGHSWVKNLYLSHGRYRVFRYAPNPDREDLTIDAVFIPAKLEDNQLLMRNDPLYESKLAASCGGDTALFRAWRQGDWDVLAGAYFKFDERVHVAVPPPAPEYLPRWISIDWGYSHSSAVLWWEDFGDRVYTYRERLYSRTDPLTLGMLIAEVNGDEKVENVYLSPDAFAKRQGEETVATALEEGFRRANEMRGTALLPPPEPAFNDRVNGWQAMAAGLEHGKWVISPSCSELIRTLPGLVRDTKRPEDVQKVEGDDVCLAGDTLVRLANGLEKAIRDMEPGDVVETPCGPGMVSAVACTSPEAEVWEVVLEGGRRVVATPGHYLYAPDGRKVRVDALSVGDTIAVWQYPIASPSTGSPSGATPGRGTYTYDGTSGPPPTTVDGVSAPCITRCGSRSTDPFPPDSTSITPTTTRSTTTFRIYDVSRRQSTSSSTTPPGDSGGSSTLSSEPDPLPPSGTARMPGGNGTGRTPDARASVADAPSRSESPVSTARPHSTTTPGTRSSDSARTDASPRGGEPPASTTSSGSANAATGPTPPTSTRSAGSARVLALRRLERPEPVFNITVDCCHRYYANGVLSANCDSARYGWATRKRSLFREPLEVRAAREIRGPDPHTRAMQERMFWARERAEEVDGGGVTLRGRRRFRYFE